MVCRHWQVQQEEVQPTQALRGHLRQLQPLRVADTVIHPAFIQVALQALLILVMRVHPAMHRIHLVHLFLFAVAQETLPVVIMESLMVVLQVLRIRAQLVHPVTVALQRVSPHLFVEDNFN